MTDTTKILDAAEKVLVAKQLEFAHHDSRPVPDGLRLLWRAQYHLNTQRGAWRKSYLRAYQARVIIDPSLDIHRNPLSLA